MATTYYTNQKNCATCQYWCGARKVAQGKNVSVDNAANKGKCVAPAKGRKGIDTQPNYNGCAGYAKWDNLP